MNTTRLPLAVPSTRLLSAALLGTVLLAACAPRVTIVTPGATTTATTQGTTARPTTTQAAPARKTLSGTVTLTENNRTLAYNCGGARVIIDGNANTIRLYGACADLTIRKNTNTVYVGSTPGVTVLGNNNRVFIESSAVRRVTDRGRSNTVVTQNWN